MVGARGRGLRSGDDLIAPGCSGSEDSVVADMPVAKTAQPVAGEGGSFDSVVRVYGSASKHDLCDELTADGSIAEVYCSRLSLAAAACPVPR